MSDYQHTLLSHRKTIHTCSTLQSSSPTRSDEANNPSDRTEIQPYQTSTERFEKNMQSNRWIIIERVRKKKKKKNTYIGRTIAKAHRPQRPSHQQQKSRPLARWRASEFALAPHTRLQFIDPVPLRLMMATTRKYLSVHEVNSVEIKMAYLRRLVGFPQRRNIYTWGGTTRWLHIIIRRGRTSKYLFFERAPQKNKRNVQFSFPFLRRPLYTPLTALALGR